MKELLEKVKNDLSMQDYNGQSIIVNYYKTNDYMNGHLDDGEPD